MSYVRHRMDNGWLDASMQRLWLNDSIYRSWTDTISTTNRYYYYILNYHWNHINTYIYWKLHYRWIAVAIMNSFNIWNIVLERCYYQYPKYNYFERKRCNGYIHANIRPKSQSKSRYCNDQLIYKYVILYSTTSCFSLLSLFQSIINVNLLFRIKYSNLFKWVSCIILVEYLYYWKNILFKFLV